MIANCKRSCHHYFFVMVFWIAIIRLLCLIFVLISMFLYILFLFICLYALVHYSGGLFLTLVLIHISLLCCLLYFVTYNIWILCDQCDVNFWRSWIVDYCWFIDVVFCTQVWFVTFDTLWYCSFSLWHSSVPTCLTWGGMAFCEFMENYLLFSTVL